VGLDGTFSKCKWQYVILTATAMDANNGVILLAASIVPTESGDTWGCHGRQGCIRERQEGSGFRETLCPRPSAVLKGNLDNVNLHDPTKQRDAWRFHEVAVGCPDTVNLETRFCETAESSLRRGIPCDHACSLILQSGACEQEDSCRLTGYTRSPQRAHPSATSPAS